MRRFIDDGQCETFQGEELEVPVDGGGGAYDDTRSCEALPQLLHPCTLFRDGVEEIGPAGFFAGKLTADTDEVDAALHQFTANLVNGTVGVRQHEDVFFLRC